MRITGTSLFGNVPSGNILNPDAGSGVWFSSRLGDGSRLGHLRPCSPAVFALGATCPVPGAHKGFLCLPKTSRVRRVGKHLKTSGAGPLRTAGNALELLQHRSQTLPPLPSGSAKTCYKGPASGRGNAGEPGFQRTNCSFIRPTSTFVYLYPLFFFSFFKK